jgi:putative N6-adenine-specific DNA methylase
MEIFFATCPRGLEALLAMELRELGAGAVQPLGGGAQFAGDFLLAYRVNLESRIASRVFWRLAGGPYRNEDDIFRAAYEVAWDRWLDPGGTIRVDVSATKSPLTSLKFVTLKIKDAVCDKLRRLTGRRPDIDTQHPVARIQAHLTARDFILYLDTTGEPLFKRGARVTAGDAPVRENLAAGILCLSGWHPGLVLLDPMCGSGTFLIEAAQMALGIAPGQGRRFAFEKLRNFDVRAWRDLRRRAAPRPKGRTAVTIYGSDFSPDAIRIARANLRAGGLEGVVTLEQADVLDLSPPAEEGIIVTNPPYGVRLGEQQALADFYPQLGNVLKHRFGGWRAYIFSADMRLPKLIRLAASKRIPLYNGALECRLFEYRMVAGSMRKAKALPAAPASPANDELSRK